MTMYHLDMLGEVCPHPLREAQRKVEEMQPGDVLVIETDFGGSVRNILAWADKEGYEYDLDELPGGMWGVKIIKKEASTDL